VWIQCFTCKACNQAVSRSGPDPLEMLEYCLQCDDLEARAEAHEAFAIRGERDKLCTVTRAA
jgi:hypothetical protein